MAAGFCLIGSEKTLSKTRKENVRILAQPVGETKQRRQTRQIRQRLPCRRASL